MVSSPNVAWSMDFMSDFLEDRRILRLLNVRDDFSREGLAVEVDISFPEVRVTRILDQINPDAWET